MIPCTCLPDRLSLRILKKQESGQYIILPCPYTSLLSPSIPKKREINICETYVKNDIGIKLITSQSQFRLIAIMGCKGKFVIWLREGKSMSNP